MKTTKKIILASCLLVFFMNSCKDTPKKENDPPKADAQTSYVLAETDSSSCDCESDWFPHSQTPPPAEGDGSPFDTSSTTNCIFHQWSWQKFLWLTKPESNGKPLFLNELTQVDAAMTPVTIPSGVNVALTANEQASTDGILRSNPNFNTSGTSATVYYSIYVDSIMKASSKEFKQQLLNGTLDPDNNKTFPVGALEVKVSWVSTDAIPSSELSNYYTTQATIGSSTTPTTVALLGMHVVGVVKNHPEFIWATFEHQSLAPVFNWETATASTDTQTLLFASGSTNNLDGITWPYGGSAPVKTDQAYILFEDGVPRVKGSNNNNFMDTSQSEPENFNNIQNLDSCVSDNLTDLWVNYSYSGSIWINTDGLTPEQQADTIVKLGGSIAKAVPGSIARGSLNASNITMETYAQTFQPSIDKISADNLTNCLSCHNAVNFNENPSHSSPLYLSHVFNGYIQQASGKTMDEIDAMKIREFKRDFLDKE